MVISPVRVPEAAGVNVTLITQVPFTARGEDVTQLSVPPKSPPTTTLAMLSGTVPMFVKVTVCADSLAPTFWLEKDDLVGENSIAGLGAVPESAIL